MITPFASVDGCRTPPRRMAREGQRTAERGGVLICQARGIRLSNLSRLLSSLGQIQTAAEMSKVLSAPNSASAGFHLTIASNIRSLR